MVPEIVSFEDVEMIRDGGSYAAKFSTVSGGRYILFFPIRLADDGAFFEPRQHTFPLIIDCDPAKRPAGSSELVGPAKATTWEYARTLIGQLMTMKSDFRDHTRSRFFEEWSQEMAEIASLDGGPMRHSK